MNRNTAVAFVSGLAISAIGLSVWQAVDRSNELYRLCEASAGTAIIDYSANRVEQRQAIVCDGKGDKGRCRPVAFADDHLLTNARNIIGFDGVRKLGTVNVTTTVNFIPLPDGRYKRIVNFKGQEPGFAGLIAGKLFGSKSIRDCYSI
jgi:hypothetical protein